MSDASPAASAPPVLDEFDRLLPSAALASAARGAPAAPPSASSEGTVEERQAPTLSEFSSGFPLYRDPIACAVLAGAGLASLGVFVVLRRAAFVTATLSTAAGLGVVASFFLEIHHGFALPEVAGALIASLACIALVGAPSSARVPRESVIATVYLVASALIVLLGSRIAQEAHDVGAILFGSAVLVRPSDVWSVLGATLVAFLLLATLSQKLAFSGFDRDGARVQGIPVERLEGVFWLVFALEVSVATRALGALPVFAFAVLPAACALAAARRLPTALFVAAAVGAASGGLGYLGAFLAELPVGASQALAAAVLSALAFAVLRVLRR